MSEFFLTADLMSMSKKYFPFSTHFSFEHSQKSTIVKSGESGRWSLAEIPFTFTKCHT
jgi:hypothetical protein